MYRAEVRLTLGDNEGATQDYYKILDIYPNAQNDVNVNELRRKLGIKQSK